MSIKVMTWVWANSTMKGSRLLLLLALADHAHDDGQGAYPSMQTLAHKTRMTVRNTQYLLRDLEEACAIQVERNAGPKGVNLYSVQMERVQTLQGEALIMGGENFNRGAIQGTGGCSSASGGVQTSAERGEAPFTQNRQEPSEEPSRKLFNKPEFPEWYKVLSRDPRWHGKDGADPHRYIIAIEREYPAVNLELEAHAAYEWLQSPKGLKKKVLKGFWRNWLKNVVAYSNNGQRNVAEEGEGEDDNYGVKGPPGFRVDLSKARLGETPRDTAERQVEELKLFGSISQH